MRVLTYHGVVDRSQQRSHFSSLFTDRRDFEAQVSFLARRCRMVPLAEVDSVLTTGRPPPSDMLHISFDDGFANNLVAAEILDRHRVPWSLFVVVDAVLDGYEPWYVRMADAIEASTNVMLGDGSVYEMTDRTAKRRFARMAKVEVMSAKDADQDGAVDRILARPGMNVPAATAWPMLKVDELKELQGAGVEVGNHSARHRNLTRCGDADLHAEVTLSRLRLEDTLGAPVRYFAYPDGRHDARVRRAVGSGHSLALATWTLMPAQTRLALRRYEPLDAGDLATILEAPEPWYGLRWAKWTIPSRLREGAMRLRRSGHRLAIG